jgi:RHS repeat-associated protein
LNTGTYTASNEKTPSGGSASYDLAGNMTGDGTQTYVYDAWDRLDQVSNGSGIVAQYSYDGAGRLVEELSGFVTVGSTPYPTAVAYDYYDGQNAIETRAATFTAGTTPTYAWQAPTQYQYVYSLLGEKTPILRDSAFDGNVPQPAGRIYYTTDANSNVTAVLNASGVVQEHYIYTAYGSVTIYSGNWSTVLTFAASSVKNTVLFASMILDPVTGQYYDCARWYDPSLGVFDTTDPAHAGPNAYRYCGNNPVIYVDPTGLWKIDRANGATATATSENGDTIGRLASNIGLNVVEYPQWLTTPKSIHYAGGALSVDDTVFNSDTRKWGNTKLCPGQRFGIPNQIMCLWYGDVGETGQTYAFDPYVQQLKQLGFSVDTYYDRDAQSVLDLVQLRTKGKYLQGMFVVGHGSPAPATDDDWPEGFGTGGGWFDNNPQEVWIKYADIKSKLAYKLGVVILWVCYGGGSGGQSISSQVGDCVFNGVNRILVPYYDYTSLSTLFADGKQGTKSP